MHWFRDNIKQGSWLALLALAINICLSFGHFHASAGKHVAPDFSSLIAPVTYVSDEAKGHAGGSQPDDLCPVCIAVSAIASGVASTPSTLPDKFAGSRPDRQPEALFVFAEQLITAAGTTYSLISNFVLNSDT
jgi:hypothetical protein